MGVDLPSHFRALDRSFYHRTRPGLDTDHVLPAPVRKTIRLFKSPPAAVGEIGVIGAVLYHAVNGLRIALFDYRPEWWQHQKEAGQVVQAVFALLYIPIAVRMLASLLRDLGRNRS